MRPDTFLLITADDSYYSTIVIFYNNLEFPVMKDLNIALCYYNICL